MARDYENQREWQYNGFLVDQGYVAFTTTSLTVDVYTTCGVATQILAWPVGTLTTPERVYHSHNDGSSITRIDGQFNISSYFRLTREVDPIVIENTVQGPVSSNNLLEAPIGCCPVAGTLTGLYWYSGVIAGGSPLMEVGKVPSYGAGTADQDFFVDSADDATNSHVPPASSVGKSIIALTASGTYAHGNTAVAAGDLITISTTGAGASDPSGTYLRAEVTPTVKSGLYVYYQVWCIRV